MTAALACDAARALVPDLALGALAGEERAALLDHLAECPSCETLSRDLAGVVDSLLLLTPEADPPSGFESGVLSRIASTEVTPLPRPNRQRRWLLAVAAAAAALVLVAGTAVIVRGGDRGERGALDQQYVSALATLGGRELRAASLVGPSGKSWGQAFVYEGTTPWVFVTMKWDVPSGPYQVVLDRSGGQPSLSLNGLRLNAGEGSFGHTVGDTMDVTRVRVVDDAGVTVCSATLPIDTA